MLKIEESQVIIQLISVVAVIVYSFVVSYILAKILDKTMNGLRVEDDKEITGLDAHLHEESAYNFN